MFAGPSQMPPVGQELEESAEQAALQWLHQDLQLSWPPQLSLSLSQGVLTRAGNHMTRGVNEPQKMWLSENRI